MSCPVTCPQETVHIGKDTILEAFGLTWKDSYQALITSSCTVTLKRIDSWINIFHWKGACAWTWSVERLPTSNSPWNYCQARTRRRWQRWSTDGPGSWARPVSPILLAQLSCVADARLPIWTESYRFTANDTFTPSIQDGKEILQ